MNILHKLTKSVYKYKNHSSSGTSHVYGNNFQFDRIFKEVCPS